MKDLKCPICGEPTNCYRGNYRKDGLCLKHAKLANKGEIKQCPDCGKWINNKETCDCKKKSANNENNQNELTCIVCGEPSNGKHFCLQCWNKYKDKVLYLKVTKCKEFEKIDAEYQSEIICDDGHLVKSKSEVLIDNYLYQKGIQHAYERPYSIDENKENDIHPDFYIPVLKNSDGNIIAKDVYIEHFGIGDENKKYKKQKNYKLEIYKRDKLTVICTDEQDIKDGCTNALDRKIKFLKPNEIN